MADNNGGPLPPGWSKTFSNSQKRYYFSHAETKHTQWHFPTASEAADPTKAIKRAKMNQEKERKRANSSTSEGGNADPNSNAAKRPRTAGEAKAVTSSSNTPAAAATAPSSSTVDDFLGLVDATSVAIIVPFRDLHPAQNRSKHLKAFVPHMVKFLTKQKKDGLVSDFHIYIMNQSDDGRKFNRGKLLNIGFDMARKSKRGHDVFIFHDVDLLPNDDLGAWYARFPKTPIHIARVWDRYSGNPKYFGGVVSFSSSDYKRINGFPNTFWGWGGEDDEMQNRLAKLGIKFIAPDKGTLKDLEEMNIEEKMAFLRKNRDWKCMVKWELLEEHEKTWKTNGLADLNYKVIQTDSLDPKNKSSKITVDVKLNAGHWGNDKAGIDYAGG